MAGLFGPVEVVGGIAVGTGVGAAVGDVVVPKLQTFLNDQWNAHQDKPVPVGLLASGLAQGQVPRSNAVTWAAHQGFGTAQLDAMVAIANSGPGVAQAFHLWRRQEIDEAGFRRAALRAALEQEWIDALVKIKLEVLDPADLARGIHRGLVPDPGLLRGVVNPGPGNVEAYPVYNIDALKEAAAAGFDHDHLGVLVGLQGLPMGSHEAAQAEFRGVINHNDYLRAIAEGNTRNEWAEAILEQSRDIPSPTNYVEGRLRNWIDDAQMYAGTARRGMTQPDTDLLFKIHGRPLSFHQVFIGERRGGTYNGATGAIDPAFLKALEESDIRPEWYNLAWAQRYSYPSAFVLRALTEAGDITQAETEQILLFVGWEPTLAKTVSTRWAGTAGAGAKTDPWVKKAEGQLWTATHKAYVGGTIDQLGANPALNAIGIDGAAQGEIFRLWDVEKAVASL